MARILSMILLVAACLGCGASSEPAIKSKPQNPLPGIEEADAIAFVERFTEAFADPDKPGTLKGLFDINAFMDIVTYGLPFKPGEEKQFRGSFSSTFNIDALDRQANGPAGDRNDYRVLRHYRGDDGFWHVLVRLLQSSQGSVDYHDFRLTKNDAGNVVADDFHVFMSGEYLSESIRRLVIQLLATRDRSFFSGMSARDAALLDAMDDMEKLAAFIKSGDGEAAIALFDTLPEAAREQKLFRMLEIQAASLLMEADAGRYQSAIGEYRRRFPNSSEIDFLSVDYFVLKERYDDALAAIRRCDQQLQDPYIKSLESNILRLTGRVEEAKSVAYQAANDAPDLIDVHWTALDASAIVNDHAKTLELLKTIFTRFEMEVGDFSDLPDYAEFLESPEYQQWLEFREVELIEQ